MAGTDIETPKQIDWLGMAICSHGKIFEPLD